MAGLDQNHASNAEKSDQQEHTENVMSDKSLRPIFISVIVITVVTALMLALYSYWFEAACVLAFGVIVPVYYAVSLKTKLYFH